MSEQQIFNGALDQLASRVVGLEYHVLEMHPLINNQELDARVSVKWGGIENVFDVEVKGELRTSQLPQILARFEKAESKRPLLISTYIPAPLKKELLALEINYLETSGNMFIQADRIYIYHNDEPVSPARIPSEGKLWSPSGLKFLFAVLLDPGLLNEPYRVISARSAVALGTIKGFFEEMEKEGFLKSRTKEGKIFRFFEQETRLRDKWAESYRMILRPKMARGRYRFMDRKLVTDWKDIVVGDFVWGGENAGALLVGYLSPEKFTVYTRNEPIELMKSLRLVPDINGELEILHRFWNDPGKEIAERTVPPLMAYSELITSFDSRCRETAERIKSRYLGQ